MTDTDTSIPIPVEHHLFRGALFETGDGRVMELVGDRPDGLQQVGWARCKEWGPNTESLVPVDSMKDLWQSLSHVTVWLDVDAQFPEVAKQSHLDHLRVLWEERADDVGYPHRLSVQFGSGAWAESGPPVVLTTIYQNSIDDLMKRFRSGMSVGTLPSELVATLIGT